MYLFRMNEDYEILGLTPTSSEDEVKAAYKRLCLIHHPDKVTGNPEKFIEISEAYQRLMIYKTTGKGANNSSQHNQNDPFTNNDGSSFMFDQSFMFDILQNLLRAFKTRYVSPKNIAIDIDCSLEDISEMNYKKVTWKWKNQNGVMETNTAYVPLFSLETTFTLEGCGDYSQLRKDRGDVLINLNRQEHKHYSLSTIMNKHDLVYTTRVNLYEYFYGILIKTPPLYESPNSEHYVDRFVVPAIDGLNILVPLKGLPTKNESNGDLYIVIEVDFQVKGDINSIKTKEYLQGLVYGSVDQST